MHSNNWDKLFGRQSCRGTMTLPEQRSETSFSILSSNAWGLWRLISGLLGIQRVFRKQHTNSWNCLLHGYSWHASLGTLPDLSHSFLAELGELVKPLYLTVQNLHTGDGLCDSSTWSTKNHLSLAAISCFYSCFSNPQQVVNLTADTPKVTPAKVWRPKQRGGVWISHTENI